MSFHAGNSKHRPVLKASPPKQNVCASGSLAFGLHEESGYTSFADQHINEELAMWSRLFKSRRSVVGEPRRTRNSPKKWPAAHRPELEMLEDRAVPANIHLVGDPTFTLVDGTLTVEGKLAGLGNKDIQIIVDAEGTATFDVRNPAGNVAPGISKKVDGSQSITVERTAFDNGHYDFSIDVTFDTGTLDLPNDQWTATLVGVDLEAVTITVSQIPKGQTVTFDFTF
jgi:hypothetical protein